MGTRPAVNFNCNIFDSEMVQILFAYTLIVSVYDYILKTICSKSGFGFAGEEDESQALTYLSHDIVFCCFVLFAFSLNVYWT